MIYALAGRLGLQCRPVLPLLAGIATPLALYSVVFWDHSTHILLTAAAAWSLVGSRRKSRFREAALAGGLLGLGVFFHEAFFLLWGALLVSLVPDLRSSVSVAGGLTAGFLPPVLAWAGLNRALYGSPGGPHSMGPNDLTHPSLVAQALSPADFVQRAATQLAGARAAPMRMTDFTCRRSPRAAPPNSASAQLVSMVDVLRP